MKDDFCFTRDCVLQKVYLIIYIPLFHSTLFLDNPLFRCVPFGILKMNNLGYATVTVVQKLKKFAIELNQESNDSNKTDYTIQLMYKDSDGDPVCILNDSDVYQALNDYSSIGKVKILAEFSSACNDTVKNITTPSPLKETENKILSGTSKQNSREYHDDVEASSLDTSQEEQDTPKEEEENDHETRKRDRAAKYSTLATKLNTTRNSNTAPCLPNTQKKQRLVKEAKGDAKVEFEEFRHACLSKLPMTYKQMFGEIGFTKFNKVTTPCLILNPFDVPPGVVRQKWIDMFIKVS